MARLIQKQTPEERREKARWARIKRVYGIDKDQYDRLFESQGGNCYICERSEGTFSRRLAIDHNHATGEIRGLLCNYCNRRIVGRHRDVSIVRRLADYLEGPHTGWVIPKKKRKVKRKKN